MRGSRGPVAHTLTQGWTGRRDGASSSASLFALFFGLNGFVQATGWPGNVKAMAAWYGPTERGAVMGFWSTCFQVGPLAAKSRTRPRSRILTIPSALSIKLEGLMSRWTRPRS